MVSDGPTSYQVFDHVPPWLLPNLKPWSEELERIARNVPSFRCWSDLWVLSKWRQGRISLLFASNIVHPTLLVSFHDVFVFCKHVDVLQSILLFVLENSFRVHTLKPWVDHFAYLCQYRSWSLLQFSGNQKILQHACLAEPWRVAGSSISLAQIKLTICPKHVILCLNPFAIVLVLASQFHS